jgi:hypothetical protein
MLSRSDNQVSHGLAGAGHHDAGSSRQLQQQEMLMFGPWITVVMLALESSEVIGLRVVKLAQGGVDAQTEAHLLVNEKIVAVFDASLRIVCGATTGHVIDRLREQVAANVLRLSAERQPALSQE